MIKEVNFLEKKKIICLKCKKEFISEVDSKGIPYKKICSNCKQHNKKYGRGLSGAF